MKSARYLKPVKVFFACLLLFAVCAPLGATNLTGTFKHPDGSPVNGKLIFLLSQPSRLNDSTAQIVPMVKIFSVTNGQLETGAFIYGNDALTPSGTYYLVRLVDANNNLLFEQKWSIQGVNLDLGTLTPTTTGVVLPDPLLRNVTTQQTVAGPVSFGSSLSALNLTLNGNLSPGTTDTNDLGNSGAAWRELFARKWGSTVMVGSQAGTATPPQQAPYCFEDTSTAPTSYNVGNLGAGTYYAVFFLLNKNGATTASPVSTGVVISGSGKKIFCRPVSYEYAHGTYALGLGMSTSPTGPFYLQTPARVQLAIANNGITYNGSGTITVTFGSVHPFWYTGPITISGATGCATDPNGAYTVNAPPPSSTTLTVTKAGGAETCGGASAIAYYDPGMAVGSQFSGAAKFIYAGNVGASDFVVTDLVTSGDVPPSTNTASIDPIQVAINSTLQISSSPNIRPSRIGMVKPLGDATYSMSTPLICFSCVIEGGTGPWFTGSPSNGTSGTPRITSSWNDPNIGTVMLMGQQSQLKWVNVEANGASNGIMYVQGDHSGNGSFLFGVTASTSTASTTTAAIKFHKMGVSQNHRWDGVSTSGGRVNVWFNNANVALLEWTDGRANCSSSDTQSSAIWHTAGPVDIYRGGKGISDPVSSAVNLRVRRVPMELCKGIGVDFGGGYLALMDNTHVADAAPTAGTVAGLRLWSDNWSSGATGSGFKLADGASLGHSGFANGAIYFGPGANDYTINGVVFENAAIAPNSSGVAIDGGNNFGRSITLINTSGITCDPNSTLGKISNVTSNFRCYSMGSRPGTGSDRAEFTDNVAICPNGARSNCNLLNNTSGIFGVVQADGTTFQWKTRHATNGGLAIRGSLQAGAEGNSSTRNFGIDLQNTFVIAWRSGVNPGTNNVDGITVNSADQLVLCSTNCTRSITGAIIQSTVSTGTAPVIVASTTEVSNLNSERWHSKQAIDFSASLDFPSIAAQSCSELTITATGAATDNAVAPSWPAALESGLAGIMFVSAADTVKVRLCNVTASAVDPASRTYAGRVIK